MADADTVWAAVVERYSEPDLSQMTNPRQPEAMGRINTTFGTKAAEACLSFWPAYAQVEFDATNPLHLEVAVSGTIAVLFARGGTSTEIARIGWDEVFSNPDSMMAQLRNTGPRGRPKPISSAPDTDNSGRPLKPWSKSYPDGLMPSDQHAR